MEFRRITGLPPYVFSIIDALKIEARRDGADVIDLGFGNPDLPSPDIAVEKLVEAARNPRNHRYSSSRGLPKLREAFADLYRRRFGVEVRLQRRAVDGVARRLAARVVTGAARVVARRSAVVGCRGGAGVIAGFAAAGKEEKRHAADPTG